MQTMLDFYQREIQSQWDATVWMITGGMHIDVEALIKHRKEIRDSILQNEQALRAAIGWNPNTKSPIEMARLFDQLGVTANRTATGRAKAAKDDLLAYAQRFPSARPVLSICSEITNLRTLQSNFLDLALDYNDYYHPTYRLNGTATGRYASQGADEGGPQGQNWPHKLLNIVIPDRSDHVLIEADLKQAEDMIVAYDANDKFAIEAFEKEVDGHRLKGCYAFRDWPYEKGIPPQSLLDSITEVCPPCASLGEKKCNHSERFLSKSSNYAFKYKMGVRKYITKQLPQAGVYITEAEGKRIRDRIVSPPVARWQDNTFLELKKTRWLINLLKRKREFYGLLDDSGEMLRSALSWKAQSVVGVIAGRAVARLERSLRDIGNGARLVTQRHDSVLVTCSARDIQRVREAISEAFFSPIPVHGRTLNIPTELKVGPNWRDLKLVA